MVNRIGDNQYTNPYVTGSKQSATSGEKAPAFLLNYDEEGVVWDRDENTGNQKAMDTAKEKAKNSTRDQSRDTYEPSAKAREMLAKDEEKVTKPQESVLKSLGQIFSGVKNIFIKAFNFIWYGNDEQKEEAIQEGQTKAEQIEGELTTESQININTINDSKNNEAAGNNEKIAGVRYKTEFDRRLERAGQGVQGVPARNTDLLTTYDGKGNIRKISATESTLILKGDKSIKL
ncbi:MAG: hypothetical protein MJ112_05055 [Lachnospiraceae bacterium]|nr:hypothetical protein [Lachnospiraceae bacterium]